MDDEAGEDAGSARRPRTVVATLAIVVAVGALAVLTSDAVAPGDRLAVREPDPGLDVERGDGPARGDAADDVALPDEVVDPAWVPVAEAPLFPRDDHPLVWTGSEAITWGGLGPSSTGASDGARPLLPVLYDGAAYDPATDEWRLIALAPLGFAGRAGHVAVWSGSEVLVWGGRGSDGGLADGAAYDPATDSWRRLAPSPLVGRFLHSGAWTGSELVIWGGVSSETWTREDGNRAQYFDGAAYNPADDTWRRLAPSPLRGRQGQQVVWTGAEVVIWGGTNASGGFDPEPAGAAYDPAADTWRTLPPAPVAGRVLHSATWAGGRMLVWGGMGESGVDQEQRPLGDGAAYDPAADRWTLLPEAPLAPRLGHSAVSTGDDLVIWGGVDERFFRGGATYDVAAGTWSAIGTSPIDVAARYPAVWTGEALLVWGGGTDPESAAWYRPGPQRPATPISSSGHLGGPPWWQPAAGAGGGPPWWEPDRG